MIMQQQKKEEEALIIDFMPFGRPGEAKKEQIAQAIGTIQFTLLELAPRADAKMEILEKIYIGKEKREKVDHIIRRIDFKDLTNSAQKELPKAIEKIVEMQEERFTNFFNKAGPINIRAHSLELLPGIGKKNLESIVKEREKSPFKNFEDMHNRVPHIISPKQIIVQRILEELQGTSKYYFFIKPPRPEGEEREYRR